MSSILGKIFKLFSCWMDSRFYFWKNNNTIDPGNILKIFFTKKLDNDGKYYYNYTTIIFFRQGYFF